MNVIQYSDEAINTDHPIGKAEQYLHRKFNDNLCLFGFPHSQCLIPIKCPDVKKEINLCLCIANQVKCWSPDELATINIAINSPTEYSSLEIALLTLLNLELWCKSLITTKNEYHLVKLPEVIRTFSYMCKDGFAELFHRHQDAIAKSVECDPMKYTRSVNDGTWVPYACRAYADILING